MTVTSSAATLQIRENGRVSEPFTQTPSATSLAPSARLSRQTVTVPRQQSISRVSHENGLRRPRSPTRPSGAFSGSRRRSGMRQIVIRVSAEGLNSGSAHSPRLRAWWAPYRGLGRPAVCRPAGRSPCQACTACCPASVTVSSMARRSSSAVARLIMPRAVTDSSSSWATASGLPGQATRAPPRNRGRQCGRHGSCAKRLPGAQPRSRWGRRPRARRVGADQEPCRAMTRLTRFRPRCPSCRGR